MKTEFNDPSDSLDEPNEFFIPKTVGELRLDPILRIQVYPAAHKAELGGIFGNRYVSASTLQEMIDELQRAKDFLDEHRD